MPSVTWTLNYSTLEIKYAKQGDIESLIKDLQDNGKHIDTVNVYGDFVESLDLPEGITTFACDHLGLRKLTLPDCIELAYLNYNFLDELEIPPNAIKIEAEHNLIERVYLRYPNHNEQKISQLHLAHNRVSQLDFDPPPTLEYIDLRCQDGFMTRNTIPDKFRHIFNDDMWNLVDARPAAPHRILNAEK